MGNKLPINVQNYIVNIEANDGKMFQMSYHSLVEHILLLRRVIDHPELTRKGPLLIYYRKDYRTRMAQGEMKNEDQQLKLPLPIEWIWHVHRLHPLNYLNDSKQLPDGLVEKQTVNISVHRGGIKRLKKTSSANASNPEFYPSIDLTDAVIRQTDFLNKFRKHFLYSYDLNQFTQSEFQNLIHDYVSFIKLAKTGQLIVPTFDIDLIWHTHMRYPSEYSEFSIATCGFILDHDDSIEPAILTNAVQLTADRWKHIYQSEYHKKKQSSSWIRRISTPSYVSTTDGYSFSCGGGDYGGGCDCGDGGDC